MKQILLIRHTKCINKKLWQLKCVDHGGFSFEVQGAAVRRLRNIALLRLFFLSKKAFIHLHSQTKRIPSVNEEEKKLKIRRWDKERLKDLDKLYNLVEFAHGNLVLGLSQYLLMLYLPRKTMWATKSVQKKLEKNRLPSLV